MAKRGGELEAADRHCRSLALRHYENFAVAAGFLSREVRVDLMRVYAYCRTTDDFGDESGSAAGARLEHWRSEVVSFFAGGAPIHPVLTALRETVQRRAIPASPSSISFPRTSRIKSFLPIRTGRRCMRTARSRRRRSGASSCASSGSTTLHWCHYRMTSALACS